MARSWCDIFFGKKISDLNLFVKKKKVRKCQYAKKYVATCRDAFHLINLFCSLFNLEIRNCEKCIMGDKAPLSII